MENISLKLLRYWQHSVGPYRKDTQNNCRTAHSLAEVKEPPLHHLQVVKLVNDQI